MSKLAELLAQREAIEVAIKNARQEEIKAAVATIHELVQRFELTVDDVFSNRRSKPASASKTPVAAKYRNPETGATWSGRGKPPKWIEGKDRAPFALT